jgi:hypothetical protein
MTDKMNERLKELMAQADYPAPELALRAHKLAELIVRECAELCDRFQARDVGMQPAECAGAIRKMFGVEE